MFFLLLSILFMVVQGLLGMASWGILCSNWLVAGVLCAATGVWLESQHLISYNSRMSFMPGWALMAAIMNLSAIYFVPDMLLWRFYALLAGFVLLTLLGLADWQRNDISGRMLLYGLIVAILASLHLPAIFAFVIVFLSMFHLLCYTMHHLYVLISGFLIGVWLIYCGISVFDSAQAGTAYLYQWLYGWEDIDYRFPFLQYQGVTRWVYPVLLPVFVVIFMGVGMLQGSFSSLRIRSLLSLVCSLSVMAIVLMPMEWTLSAAFCGFLLMLQVLLTMGNQPSQGMQHIFRVLTLTFMCLSIGEPVIVMLIDFVSSVDFSWLWSWWYF